MNAPEHPESFIIWHTPVSVRIGHGQPELINSPHEGLSYLKTRWPIERADKYAAAKRACEAAIDRKGSSQVAREAFIAAAIEANLLA